MFRIARVLIGRPMPHCVSADDIEVRDLETRRSRCPCHLCNPFIVSSADRRTHLLQGTTHRYPPVHIQSAGPYS
jgi:hypothetical protein